MRIGLSYRKRKNFIVWIAAAAVLIIFVLLRFVPVFITQLTCHANTIVTDRVNKAVYDAFSEYSGFEEISEKETGTASSMSADMSKFNKMRSNAVVRVQNELNAITSDYVYIPLLSVTGIPVLSGSGIKIPVRVVPMTTVDADYSESFSSVGINQSLYNLNMDIIVSVAYCGFAFNKTDTITTSVPVISTVINGDVPDYYGLLSGTDASIN